MDKINAKSFFSKLAIAGSVFLLSACITQNYENDSPVVENQANLDEMAATRISLGLGYLKMGNMAQAKLNLEKARKFSPELVQVYTAFAHYYEVVGENKLTEESYQKALSIKSDDADTLNNYGVFLCRQKQVDKAEKQFLKAIAVPSYILVAKSYENLASCYLQVDNFDKAEHYLEKSIDHSPNNSSTLFQMVRLQYAKGDYNLAKQYQQKFERYTRRFTPESLALSYKLHMKLRQSRVAKNYATMLANMYPQSWEGQQYLLNELELIEADNLAKRYQITQRKKQNFTQPSGSNKRVVKLSPGKGKKLPSREIITKKYPEQNTPLNVGKGSATNVNTTAAASSNTPTIAAVVVASNIESSTNQSSTNEAQANEINVNDEKLTQPLEQSNTASTISEPNKANENDTAIVTTASTDETVNVNTDNIPAESISTDNTALSSLNDSEVLPVSTNEPTEKVAVSKLEPTTETSPDSLSALVVQQSAVEPIELVEQEVTAASKTELSDDSGIEPTSTAPIPAKRDAPLPEAKVTVINNETSNDVLTNTEVNSAERKSDDSVNSTITDEELARKEAAMAQLLSGDTLVIDSTTENSADNKSEVITSEAALVTELDSKVDVLKSDTLTEQVKEQANNETSTAVAAEVTKEDSLIDSETEVVVEETTNNLVDENEQSKLPTTHKVSKGETLFAISVKYNVKIKALREWNNISSNNRVRIGEKLYVVDPNTVTEVNE